MRHDQVDRCMIFEIDNFSRTTSFYFFSSFCSSASPSNFFGVSKPQNSNVDEIVGNKATLIRPTLFAPNFRGWKLSAKVSTTELSGGELWRNGSRKKVLGRFGEESRSSYVLVASNRDRIIGRVGARRVLRYRGACTRPEENVSARITRVSAIVPENICEFSRKASFVLVCLSSCRDFSSVSTTSTLVPFFISFFFFLLLDSPRNEDLRVHIFRISFQSERSQTHEVYKVQ